MPETKEGTCEFCERHNQTLYFTVGGFVDGILQTAWLCHRCREAIRQIKIEKGLKEDA